MRASPVGLSIVKKQLVLCKLYLTLRWVTCRCILRSVVWETVALALHLVKLRRLTNLLMSGRLRVIINLEPCVDVFRVVCR